MWKKQMIQFPTTKILQQTFNGKSGKVLQFLAALMEDLIYI